MKKETYKAAGVDIALANRLKSGLPKLISQTHRCEMIGGIGGFGGLFALNVKRYRQPVLVSSVDGVGTKLKIAFAMDKHDTVGQDLVNHCVNDIAVLGAEPLFFLDYIGTGKLEPRVFHDVIRGLARACSQNNCALIGGETAQMPGFYKPGEYDLCGTIVGVVERSAMLDGRRSIRPGDAVVGLASSGLHTNGYSLARKVFFDKLGLKPHSYVPELGCTIGEELLKVHKSYGTVILDLLKKFNKSRIANHRSQAIRAFAHITGGGFYDNIPRVLPRNCDVVINKGSWEIPLVFKLIADHGRVNETEMYHVFNMGVGMVAIVEPGAADAVLRSIRAKKQKAWFIGTVERGSGKVQIC